MVIIILTSSYCHVQVHLLIILTLYCTHAQMCACLVCVCIELIPSPSDQFGVLPDGRNIRKGTCAHSVYRQNNSDALREMSEAIVEDDRHLEALRKQLSAKEKECRQKDEVIKEKDAALVEKDATIKEQQTHIQRLREQLRKVSS